MKRKKKLKAACYAPGFVYHSAVDTDVAATFARVRERLANADKEQVAKIAG